MKMASESKEEKTGNTNVMLKFVEMIPLVNRIVASNQGSFFFLLK